MLANTFNQVHRKLSEAAIVQGLTDTTHQTRHDDHNLSQLNVQGLNPINKFSREFLQVSLLKQMKTILDPKAYSYSLYKAGSNFLKLLNATNKEPSEEEVWAIVHFICSNQDLPLDVIIDQHMEIRE